MYQTYRNLWLALNKTRLQPGAHEVVANKYHMAYPDIFRSFEAHSHRKIINIRGIDEMDRDYLAKEGISTDYLLRNLRKTIRGAYLDALAFQLRAIHEKAVYAVCPFTGKLIASHHSLLANINVIFYRFDSVQVFYVITAGLDGFKKNALYFPQQELIVTSGKAWTFEESDLIELQARMVCNFDACYRYLSNYKACDKKVAVCIGFFHFAHHLWNELPGIGRLVRTGTIDNVDKFLVLREPLGDILQIFPEIPTEKLEKENSTDAIFDYILNNNYLVVRVGEYVTTRDTITRVYEVAKANSRPETLDLVRQTRQQHFPLLWIGIRVGSRTWVNQVTGLTRLIEALYAEFPRLGIVFDGFSLPADRSDQLSDKQEYDKFVLQENRVVNDIIETLSQNHRQTPGIFNIVGSSIYDANVWANAIDVYVSPYGSLQHKVGWFANKPGIIHANTTVLDHSTKYVWVPVENAIRPRYVPPTAVADVRSIKNEAIIYRQVSDLNESGAGILSAIKRVQGDPEFDNYELDWEALYSKLIYLVRCHKIKLKLDPEMITRECKRRVKKILHTIINTVDSDKI